jgi:hypothetical protein
MFKFSNEIAHLHFLKIAADANGRRYCWRWTTHIINVRILQPLLIALLAATLQELLRKLQTFFRFA